MAERKVVTLQDIADAVGVHKSTVHHALRGDPRVEAGTAGRIRAAAERLGYDPEINQAARRLSLRKTGRREPTRLVAVIFPVVFTRGPYFLRMFMSLTETLCEARHDVLCRINEPPDLYLPPAVTRGDADAVVSLTHPDELAAIRDAIAAGPPALRRPLITLINPLPGAWTATADLRQGGRLAMNHLLDLGHRSLVSIGNMAFRSEERIAGCREALAARGLDPERHFSVADADFRLGERERLEDVLDRLLAARPDATAMLAPQDWAAHELIPLLAARGRPVPARMSLIGFDDTDAVPGPDGRNMLSSVALPLEDIGRAAARLAMDPGPVPRSEILPVVLRPRGTTTPPPT